MILIQNETLYLSDKFNLIIVFFWYP